MPTLTKLLLSFLLVVAVTGCMITVAGVTFMNHAAMRHSQRDVDRDLKLAFDFLNSRQEAIRTALVCASAQAVTVRRALMERDLPTLSISLSNVKHEHRLDVLGLTDATGNVLLRLNGSEVSGDDLSRDDLVYRVLKQREPLASTSIWSSERVEREMQPQSAVNHAPDDLTHPRCLLLTAAVPVFGNAEDLTGVLYGGIVLDCEPGIRYPVVASTHDAIFGSEEHTGLVSIMKESTPFGESGNLDGTDIRHSRYHQDGTWYIGASRPLHNIVGEPVGLVHVAASEKQYSIFRRKAVMIFLGITATGIVAALAISLLLSARIVRPLHELSEEVEQLSNGNLDYRFKEDKHGSLSSFAATLNHMADSIQQRDVQIQKNTQEMMEAKRLANLGQLAAGVAHEINNPLGAITVYAHLLDENLDTDNPACENIRKIIREADRCKGIVRDLLGYSRQGGPRKETADINAICTDALNLASQQTIFSHIEVERHFSAGLPPADVDVSQMEQVLINILINAAEAMRGEGPIEIATAMDEENDRILIKITDEGPGIPPEHLERIFEPFFTNKPTGRGTGLGLAISTGIVESHGGSIEAVNNPSGGATFIVALPVKAQNT